MKLATWNLNSIRAREARLLSWIERHTPDVLCLQELKCKDSAFPLDAVRALGYHAVVHGQPTYNGVAILSRSEPQDVRIGFGDDTEDPQARVVAATIEGIRVLSVYVPNGGALDSDKFSYKLRWLERLERYLVTHHVPSESLALCGDLNIAPADIDVARPREWEATVLCCAEVRAAFQRLLDWGLVDSFRHQHPEAAAYSWWDYRALGFPKNNGLRIDHILVTRPLLARCTDNGIDREERKGKQPSDHAPVISVFDGTAQTIERIVRTA